MGSRLTIRTPSDYLLKRDVCSYGYFVLAPNHWDPSKETLDRWLDLEDGPTGVRIVQPDRKKGSPLAAKFDRALSKCERDKAKRQIARMLRLDESSEDLRAFHRVDPRWKKSGRGRLFRSPSMFEDVVKTVTSCNVAWPSTVNMNTRLCEVLGRSGAFPRPEKLRRARATTLRARCRVGYRDQRIIDLAKLFSPRGKRPPEADPAWFEDPSNSDDDVFKALVALPGVGPYAAGNIMQLLGRYSRLALDTESLRHGRTVLEFKGNDRAVLKRLERHYERFGEHRFRSYWFELWDFYESKQGPAWTWERERTAKAFTAANF